MDLIKKLLARDIWNISGDFGRIQADNFKFATEKYEISCEYKKDENGVYHYTGMLKNISDDVMTLNCLKAKFHLGGGEFNVYTQYNTWQNENIGMWQPLNTEVTASIRGLRAANGAAPFMAIKNKQTGRGVVFHLLADYAWAIQARRVPVGGENSSVQVEIGVNSENFLYRLLPGQSIQTPEIIFYEFTNDIDLDCQKLHSYWTKNHKRRFVPVAYNTWMCRFDKITYENVANQIERASRIGAEYFIIDAGWFGVGKEWFNMRGDWVENTTGALCGKMSDIADDVRAHNMKFGIWFEIETASDGANALKENEDCFINKNGLHLLDFAKPKARQYIFDVLKANIDKYNIEYIKFDFNEDVDFDSEHKAYIDYHDGYRDFVRKLKSEYPNLYLENCASGGLRVDLKNSIDFDSFWLSDNPDPYEGMRIFKEGIKRLPPQCIEKWAVIRSLKDFRPNYMCDDHERIISAHDGTWHSLTGVNQSYLNGFLSGGPLGISCDLNEMSDELLDNLTEHISLFKQKREFWQNAVCRILADTDKLLVLEYSTSNEIEIIVYADKIMQDCVYVYPTVNDSDIYLIDGNELSGKDISENGISVKIPGNYHASFVRLERK